MKLLIDPKGRKYLVDAEEFHTRYGIVRISEAMDGRVKSHLGHEFSLLEPKLVDLYEKMPRAGSIVLKKDLGTILAYTGVGTGDIVVDAGAGSGALALYLANLVRPTGKVYSYEIREEHARIAGENLARAGLAAFAEIKLKDIREGIDEKDVDLVTLDLPDPWNVAGHAYAALKRGGFMVSYTPYVEQTRKAAEALKAAGFMDVKSLEILERELEIKDVGCRPKTRTIGHTAYLTFGRKR